MSSEDGEGAVYASDVGPVIAVGRVSLGKVFACSLLWAVPGVTLLAGGASILCFELPRLGTATPVEWPVTGIGAGCILVGWLFTAILLRRIGAGIGSDGIYFRAGPKGVSVRFPAAVRWWPLLLRYHYRAYDIAWDRVRRWYPYVVRINGIPTTSEIVFEGTDGWEVRVPTVFFSGTRKGIAGRIGQAIERTDLAGDSAAGPD